MKLDISLQLQKKECGRLRTKDPGFEGLWITFSFLLCFSCGSKIEIDEGLEKMISVTFVIRQIKEKVRDVSLYLSTI